MIKVGDLVESRSSGKVGIITEQEGVYYHVLFHDDTYIVHTDNLKPLETK